jgi:O-antigen ligase
VLLPIPLGANRPWAWSFFELAIFALIAFVVINHWKIKKLGMQDYISAVYIWMIFIAICALQIIPLPGFVVSIFSPTSFELFSSVSAESFYISVDPGQSMVSFIKLLSFFCLFVCVLVLANTEQRTRLLLLTIMLSGTAQAFYGMAEIFLGLSSSLVFEIAVSNSATGSFVYNNHYANFLMLCIAAGIGLLVTSFEQPKEDKPQEVEQISTLNKLFSFVTKSNLIIYICIPIMIISMVLSRSTIGIASLFIALAIAGAVAYLLVQNRSRGLTALVVGIFIVNLCIVSAYLGIERVKDRLAQTTFAVETQHDILQDAYPIIADYPLFGAGAGSFYSTFPSYQTSEVNAFYDHLHSDYVQFLIEYGIVGCFALFTLFLFCIYKSMRAMLRRRNSLFKGAAFACLMVFIGMGAQMFTDFPMQGFANACYFVVYMALSMTVNTLNGINPNTRLRTG